LIHDLDPSGRPPAKERPSLRDAFRSIRADVRAFLADLARKTRGDPSAMFLVAINLGAAVVAMRHPPVTMSFLFVYWAECGVIGVLNIVKLFFIPVSLGPNARAGPRLRFAAILIAKTFVALFFTIHYGVFLLIVFFALAGIGDQELKWLGVKGFDVKAYFASFLVPIASLALGHVVSFFVNFVGKREYAGRTLENQMLRPYKRVAFMFGAAWAGVFLTVLLRVPGVTLLAVLPAKIIADLHAHFRDRRRPDILTAGATHQTS